MNAFMVALLLVLAFARVDGAQSVTKLEGQIVCCEECRNRADRVLLIEILFLDSD